MVKDDKKLDPLITIDPVTGRLVYHTTKHGERLLDYSVCGYKGGGVALPAATVGEVREVEPAPGNTADHCESDDTERLQAKIDTMGIDGGDDPFKGHKPDAKLSVLLLKAGTYYVKGQLKVIKHGVVIRGEGPDVTTIIATGKDKRSVIHLVGGRMGKPFNKYGNFPITGDHVRLGETTIPVKHDGHLGPGDRVWLRRKPNQKWIHRLGMDTLHEKDKSCNNWSPGSYVQDYERFVVGVPDKESIIVHTGVPCTIQQNFGGGQVLKLKNETRISHVAVENLQIVSTYVEGKEYEDDDHAWNAVVLDSVKDAWVRNVTARHFGYSCVNVGKWSIRVTVQDCKYLEPVSKLRGGHRYSFNCDGQMCLFQRCYSDKGRHSFVNGSRICGPNVFLDCVSENDKADSGPHHRWSVSTLFDRVQTQALNAQNRGTSGSGHGWAGANMVFWNCRTVGIICQHPPAAENFCIGCIATGKITGDGHIESFGTPVAPESLYLAQLRDRLGMKAVRQVATPEQYAFLE